jgi:tripartite-type tricarboxylate transporter receptor subunit TctC
VGKYSIKTNSYSFLLHCGRWLRVSVCALPCAMTFALPATALAQAWPQRPVRVVVPWAPGGITDVLARLTAERLAQSFGQPFIVDNRAGVAGNIGAELVARATPDGHTLMVTNPGAFATNQFLYQKMNYKPADFAGVILLGQFPNALMVYRDLPVKTVGDLIGYAKKNPTALNGASSGSGSSGHLSLEMFKALTGVQMQNVFYKGAALSKIDLAAGRVQVAIDNIPGYLSELTSGTVRMLAVGTKSRLPGWPDIPTLDEAGVKGYESSVWYAMAAPRATAANIVRRINEVAGNALRTPQMQERFKQLHGIPMGGTPEDANRYFAEETQRWKTIIAAAGIKPE